MPDSDRAPAAATPAKEIDPTPGASIDLSHRRTHRRPAAPPLGLQPPHRTQQRDLRRAVHPVRIDDDESGSVSAETASRPSVTAPVARRPDGRPAGARARRAARPPAAQTAPPSLPRSGQHASSNAENTNSASDSIPSARATVIHSARRLRRRARCYRSRAARAAPPLRSGPPRPGSRAARQAAHTSASRPISTGPNRSPPRGHQPRHAPTRARDLP